MNKDDKFFDIIFKLAFLIFIGILIYSLFIPRDMWWDASVYIGMGKHIFSNGESGLWEPSRPLIWPIMLGFLWTIGLDEIFFGRFLLILFSIGTVIVTYMISSKVFGKKIAILSSIFLMFSSTFLTFSGILYTEILSMFFALLGLYFYFGKKHKSAGLFLGLSFMTRFFNIFLILPILAVYFYQVKRRKISFRNFLMFLGFFSIPLAIFLIINAFLYSNLFYPFALQTFMTKNTGWIFHEPFSFYFVNILKENYLVIFAIIGGYIIARKETFDQKILPLIIVFAFLLYDLERHKEMRLILGLLPFIFMLTALGIFKVLNNFKKSRHFIFVILLLPWIFQSFNFSYDKYDDKLGAFYKYMQTSDVKTGIWVSNPSFILYSNKKANELIYYPLYNSQRIIDLKNKIRETNLAMINTCDLLPCPEDDLTCEQETKDFIILLKKDLRIILDHMEGNCNFLILEKTTS